MDYRSLAQRHVGDRSSRFAVEMPMRFRPIGEIGWTQAKTINISRSGVLFGIEQPLPEETPVELVFDLPVEMGGGAGTEVTCRGQIVRTILPPATDAPPAVAVAIADYRSLGN